MPLDCEKAKSQIESLRLTLNDVENLKRGLSIYQCQLNKAWLADEIFYFNRIIDSLKAQCEQLKRSIDNVQQDMTQAMEDIQREEEQGNADAHQMKEWEDRNGAN